MQTTSYSPSLLKDIHSLIDKNHFQTAQEKLKSLTPIHTHEKRIQLQLEAKIYLRKNQYEECIEKLKNALKHGEHLSLYSDLTSAYYLNNDYENWRCSLQNFIEKYQFIHPKLSLEYQTKCTLVLGNHLEENGQLSEAIHLYLEFLKKIESSPDHTPTSLRLISQILRLSAFLKEDKKSFAYYKKLIQLKEASPNIYDSITIQHALMIYELTHLGLESAYARIKSLNKLNEYDLALLHYDFYEISIALGYSLSHPRLEAEILPKPTSTYEKILHELFTKNEGIKIFEKIPSFENKISFSCLLQVLGCLHQMLNSSELKQEIQKKMNLLISVLDKNDQNLWRHKYSFLTTEYKLFINPVKNILSVDQKSLSLGRRRVQMDLLLFFTKKQASTFEELTDSIWGSQYNLSYNDRIRRNIERINKTVNQSFGVPLLFKVEQNKIQCLHKISTF